VAAPQHHSSQGVWLKCLNPHRRPAHITAAAVSTTISSLFLFLLLLLLLLLSWPPGQQATVIAAQHKKLPVCCQKGTIEQRGCCTHD
jgi:hypothetical protein